MSENELLGYVNIYRLDDGTVEIGAGDIDKLVDLEPWAMQFEEHAGIAEIRLLPDTAGKTGEQAEVQPHTFQERVAAAHHALFHDDPTDIQERRDRFGEEALEVLQAFGMTLDELVELAKYTWSRPVGEPIKEVGAAALTLASLCAVSGLDLSAAAESDLEKLQRPETIERIRAKRTTRHGRGPLPGFDPAVHSPSSPLKGE